MTIKSVGLEGRKLCEYIFEVKYSYTCHSRNLSYTWIYFLFLLLILNKNQKFIAMVILLLEKKFTHVSLTINDPYTYNVYWRV
jgi:hypothetical protein